MKPDRPLILASTSPRRQFLLKAAGFHFRIAIPHGDESYPGSMAAENVPLFLAEKKAISFKSNLTNEIVITADTVVILGNHILNKPDSREEAIQMLTSLAGRTHIVITAVCLLAQERMDLFEDRSYVTFKELPFEEIEQYVDNFQPFDKAGAYGAQDCLPAGMNPCSVEEIEFLARINKLDLIEKSIITQAGTGMVSIEKISGSYFNVMGLPIHKVHAHLMNFL